jgi:hypothetical protein
MDQYQLAQANYSLTAQCASLIVALPAIAGYACCLRLWRYQQSLRRKKSFTCGGLRKLIRPTLAALLWLSGTAVRPTPLIFSAHLFFCSFHSVIAAYKVVAKTPIGMHLIIKIKIS